MQRRRKALSYVGGNKFARVSESYCVPLTAKSLCFQQNTCVRMYSYRQNVYLPGPTKSLSSNFGNRAVEMMVGPTYHVLHSEVFVARGTIKINSHVTTRNPLCPDSICHFTRRTQMSHSARKCGAKIRRPIRHENQYNSFSSALGRALDQGSNSNSPCLLNSIQQLTLRTGSVT